MSFDLEIPIELLDRPLSLVGLAGLNVATNPTHVLIWNSFSSTVRNDRPPLNCVLIENNFAFQQAKPDRTSYEWYIPKGILKRRWMHKHLYQIPGVLVLFYDLEWEDPSWKAKQLECANQLKSFRTALSGRCTKFVLVVVQNNIPLPPGEDALAADRAAALCEICELPPKSLFVLPVRSDHLQGYTIRLENAFNEMCKSSYHHSILAVRSHKDQLNRTNHGYLFVRHQFKIGFYNELKQDMAMACKHYTQAYAYLLELRITDANINEIKIAACYIGYKVWKLSFLLNLPREAISRFKNHLDFFRQRIGHPLSRFEHSAWLAHQYTIFGKLFEEAIESGLPAIQAQHPGFYYQQAAQHAINRKDACIQDFVTLDSSNLPPLIEIDYFKLEFYGQRPWRPSRLSLEASDMKAELDGITNMLIWEKNRTDHTACIVNALTSAANQFKNNRSPRMKQQLLVQMAREYYQSGNFREALAYLEPLLWDYRKDFWWIPLTSLLQLSLRCAYLSGRIVEYFTNAVELCSTNTVNNLEDKKRLFNNLIGILQKKIPPPEEDVGNEPARNALKLWNEELDKNIANNSCITIVTNTISSFVEINATFGQKQYFAETPIELIVYVRYSGPESIRFSALSVALNNAAYSPFCQVRESSQLFFEPGQVQRFEFKMSAESQDIGGELQIASVTLQLGDGLVAFLRCEGSTSEEFVASATRAEFPPRRKTRPIEDGVVHCSTEILPRLANISLVVEHYPPALRGECYPLRIQLLNKELDNISDVEIAVTCPEGRIHDQPKIDYNCTSSLKLSCQDISAGDQRDWMVFVQIEQPGTCDLNFLVHYRVNSRLCGSTCVYKSEYAKTVSLETIQPIECEAQFQTLQFQPLTVIPEGESFTTVVSVSNLSPFSLLLEQGVWKLHSDDIASETLTSQLSNLVLHRGEKGIDVAILHILRSTDNKIQPGSFSLKWKRANFNVDLVNTKIPYSVCSYELPVIETSSIPLRIQVELPAHGYVREPLNASVMLKNASNHSMELDVSMDSNDAFMFSGNKQISVQIYPGDEYKLYYNLYPLLSGFVALPPLHLKCTGSKALENQLKEEILEDLVTRHLPSHIYVLPQAKEKQAVTMMKA